MSDRDLCATGECVHLACMAERDAKVADRNEYAAWILDELCSGNFTAHNAITMWRNLQED